MAGNSVSRPPGGYTRLVVDFEWLRKVSGSNFRELGSIYTRHGKKIRSGVLYRSAHLSSLPPDSPIRQLPLQTVITLQSHVELQHLGYPEPTVIANARWTHIPIGDQWFQNGQFTGVAKDTRVTGREHLILAEQFPEAWREFLVSLAQPDSLPVLFHCSAGRDRTGVAAAILLEALGVDRDVIIEDFLASNKAFPRLLLTREMLEPVLAFIDSHGGIEGFLEKHLKLPPETLKRLHETLLED